MTLAPVHRLPDPPPARGYSLTRMDTVKASAIEWLVPGRVPMGGLTVVAGPPGQGKSQFTLMLAAKVTTGDEPAPVILIGAEDGLADTVRPRLIAAGADSSLVHSYRAKGAHGDELMMLPTDVPLLEEAVMSTGAQLVVVDPFAAFLAPELNAMSDHSLRQATAPLAQMAQRTHCAVVVVSHLRKSREGSTLDRVAGSVGLTGQARSVLLMGRAKDPTPMTRNERYLVHVKSNGAQLADTMVFEIVGRSVEADGLWIDTSAIGWVRTDPEVNAHDIE